MTLNSLTLLSEYLGYCATNLVVLGIEPRASCMQGQPLLTVLYAQLMQSHKETCLNLEDKINLFFFLLQRWGPNPGLHA